LKLSPELISDVQKDIEDYEDLEVVMHFGEEILNANFRNDNFSISVAKNKELEHEIAGEINDQFKKNYPKTCPQFLRRVYEH
jgi:hypothetical protein